MILFIFLVVGQFGNIIADDTTDGTDLKLAVATNSCVERMDYSQKCLQLVGGRLQELSKFYQLISLAKEYSPKQFLQKRSSTVTQFERMLNRARLNEARARERAVMQSIVAPMAEDFDY